MKLLDKLISFVFSVIILVLAIAVVMVCLEYISADSVYAVFDEYVFSNSVKDISLITAICVILGALKTTIFSADFKKRDKEPIMVETDHGMVEIAQDTIDNTVCNVATTFFEIKDVQAKMLKKKNGIKIYVVISVLVNTNLKDLTFKLQEKIKEVIDATTGVKVLCVNIKVKNIYEKNKKQNKITLEDKKTEISENIEKETVVSEVANEVIVESTEQKEENGVEE